MSLPEPFYADDHVTVFHADARDVLPLVEADVMVTDPPYGMSYVSHSAKAGPSDPIAADKDTSLRDWALEQWGSRPALVFGTWRMPRPTNTVQLLVWDQGGSPGMGNLSVPWGPGHEEIYVLGTGFTGTRRSNVIRVQGLAPTDAERPDHPTPKPVGLMTEPIRYCPPGVIVDPFMGSGTTLRAAKNLGRRAVGVECEERYCRAAVARLRQEVLDLGGAV